MNTILDALMAIPTNAIAATVLGVEMQIISTEQADTMLGTDYKEDKIHECLLPNGRFLFESNNGELVALYKVQN